MLRMQRHDCSMYIPVPGMLRDPQARDARPEGARDLGQRAHRALIENISDGEDERGVAEQGERVVEERTGEGEEREVDLSRCHG